MADLIKRKDVYEALEKYFKGGFGSIYSIYDMVKEIPTVEVADHKTEPQYDFGDYADRLWKIAYERGKREALEQTEPQLIPNYCGSCKHREVPCGDLPCDVCHNYSNYEPQTERLEQFRVGLEYHTDTTHFGKTKGESVTTNKVEDEPQTERSE